MKNEQMKKDCSSVRIFLSSYIDNELNETEREYCKAHIAECQLCRKELDNMYKMSEMVSSVYTEANKEVDFSKNIMARINANKKYGVSDNNSSNIEDNKDSKVIPIQKVQKPTFLSRLMYGGAVAAAMVISIGGTVAYFQSNSSIEPKTYASVDVNSTADKDHKYDSYVLEHFANSYSEYPTAKVSVQTVNFSK